MSQRKSNKTEESQPIPEPDMSKDTPKEKGQKVPDVVFLGVSAVAVLVGQLIARCSEGLPVICWLAFVVQWIIFIHAGWNRTEIYFDLTGSATYFSLAVFSFSQAKQKNTRQLVLTAMVLIWCIRLGSFLFARIHKAGKDSRFDKIKHRLPRFFNFWTIQGLWVFLTALPVWITNSTDAATPVNVIDCCGWGLWLVGFAIEVTADQQKTVFRSDDSNKGKFISSGLWAYSRHPNYLGEIILWSGVYISSTNVLVGATHVALLSPLFVVFLLTKVSGIPLLEKSADKKWGGDKAYQTYKATTGCLVPGFP